MPSRVDELHLQIARLERELDDELHEARSRWRYRIESGRIRFDREVRAAQRRLKRSIPRFLHESRLTNGLTAPVIYSIVVPVALLDLWVSLYQRVCFPVYRIARVRRADYIVIDRQHLAYLNGIEKLNCMFCGYANGVFAYVREIAGRTEQVPGVRSGTRGERVDRMPTTATSSPSAMPPRITPASRSSGRTCGPVRRGTRGSGDVPPFRGRAAASRYNFRMRLIMRLVRWPLLAALAAGCTATMRDVPVTAGPADWEILTGDWRGEYTMDGHDRHGLIAFKLLGGRREASGDVLMIPDTMAWPYGAMPRKDLPPQREAERSAQLLTIHFVEADRGEIRGSLDSYWDPDRECQSHATFTGTVLGDVIRGTFVTVCENGREPLRGRWRVDRNRHR